MTWVPHTVDVGESVAGAWHRMHTLGVEHLPVIEEGQLVGMLALPELDAIWSSEARDPFKVPVSDVMRKNPRSVPPAAPISEVVRAMRTGPDDCCAVVEEGQLLGIVTTRDALRLLDELLARPETAVVTSLRPSEVRARILAEHELLRTMFARADDLLRDVANEPSDAAEAALYEHCRELYLTVLHHIELENAILAPALREADGFGEARAAQLLSEHERQRKSFLQALATLETHPLVETADAIAALIGNLRSDMAHEERALLDPDLLKDDCIDGGSCEG
jgi:acetoin utilization protein AcuB